MSSIYILSSGISQSVSTASILLLVVAFLNVLPLLPSVRSSRFGSCDDLNPGWGGPVCMLPAMLWAPVLLLCFSSSFLVSTLLYIPILLQIFVYALAYSDNSAFRAEYFFGLIMPCSLATGFALVIIEVGIRLVLVLLWLLTLLVWLLLAARHLSANWEIRAVIQVRRAIPRLGKSRAWSHYQLVWNLALASMLAFPIIVFLTSFDDCALAIVAVLFVAAIMTENSSIEYPIEYRVTASRVETRHGIRVVVIEQGRRQIIHERMSRLSGLVGFASRESLLFNP
ncbi:MAG: hypothetical protein HXY34_13335 [Candidatus Thorarchaeota archaeon]|nr:hypothetical protein [Candidatus Thorarchaeota archaeon]